ncbi:MAG: L-aspartate oxidase [Armatimonadetes bacterium]|nr:L-aspartate oxidase [Armatimonadota bacterium]
MTSSTAVDPGCLTTTRTDFVVVGSGVAGLWTALHLARHGRVALLTKDALQESNTQYAQGGIAVALAAKDSPELHLEDTIAAGAGLVDLPAAEVLTYEASQAIADLMDAGAEFDREEGPNTPGPRRGAGVSGPGPDAGDTAAGIRPLLLGQEAAHGHRRIIHARGDATGAEVERALIAQVRAHDAIDLYEEVMAVRLLVANGQCLGVEARDLAGEANLRFLCRGTCLCTGGLGCIYRRTTNPLVATGDGVALAFRAGALVRDMEFVQFHPTALATPGTPKFLISEAVRGEGAILLNAAGEAFMERYHPRRELAPRDEVARAVLAEIKQSGEPFVFLDFGPIGEDKARQRFPMILAECEKRGFEPLQTPIPVSPVAHYAMGGIDTDLVGATSVKRLYAAGECACTGVHGANRLASNSLLEGLVFGARAAKTMAKLPDPPARSVAALEQQPFAPVPVAADVYGDLREMMWDDVGIIRSEHSLNNALKNLARFAQGLGDSATPGRWEIERANMILVADIIVRAALNRKESRGAHYRTDFPEPRQSRLYHNLLHQDSAGNVRTSARPVDLSRKRKPVAEG